MMVTIQYGDAPLDNHFFEKNLQSLKTHTLQSENLPDILSKKLSMISTSSGQPTLRFENTLLHSSCDPDKEARQFAEKLKPGASICLYGFGLSYHLTTILNKIGPDGRLLTIELNPGILTAALKLKDQSAVLEDRRFRLIYRTDEAEVSGEISQKMEHIIQANLDTRVFNLYSHGAEIEQAPVLGSANELRTFLPAIS